MWPFVNRLKCFCPKPCRSTSIQWTWPAVGYITQIYGNCKSIVACTYYSLSPDINAIHNQTGAHLYKQDEASTKPHVK